MYTSEIIEITTPTCSICKMLRPMIEKVVSSYPSVKLSVYDYEDSNVKHFFDLYNIKSVPTFFFLREGDVVDTHFGAITLSELKTKIEKIAYDS